MDLEALLTELAQEPNDFTLRRVTADWCEENGQPVRAGCLRWMARNRKRPYHGKSAPACWFNADKVKGEQGDVESDVPEAVYVRLQGGQESANHKTFPSLRAAEEAFHAAWAEAVRAGWDAADVSG